MNKIESILLELFDTYILPQKSRQLKKWMDLDGTLEEFGNNGRLKERIYKDNSNQ